MNPTAEQLAEECKRQEENCLYTGAALHVWLRKLRFRRNVFTATPLVLGTLAGWSVLKQVEQPSRRGYWLFAHSWQG